MKLVEARVEAEKGKTIIEAKMKAINKFRASSNFKAEIAEGSKVSFRYRFDACKAQVARWFPKVDID